MEKKKVQAIVKDTLVCKYGLGRGPSAAWAHLSEELQHDAKLAAAAGIVLAQCESIHDSLTFADAVAILRNAIAGEN